MNQDPSQIKTLKELKAAGYKSRSIKDEMRDNLIERLKKGAPTFSGIHGYEQTVVPELERAILSKHNINLLGLRGQAKTRMARQMIGLLDPLVPIVAGSEINDDPFNPLSRYAQDLIAEQGDQTPIAWLAREDRFSEKLATPDVTVADLIGDVDPIKAANLKLTYADDRVIHFGMIPRANRCIFVINELPDLQARIQVALFNILQEGDIQIRGFKLRLPLDMQFVFTANPEDYTNRGSIVTPLKDRIGSQILTHYPQNLEIARTITSQETEQSSERTVKIHVPEMARDILEQISFEARKSEFIDVKSGVSARLSISGYENLLSTTERRALKAGAVSASVRLSDFMGIIPAITGKVELVYEGEQEGAAEVAERLLNDAVKTQFENYYPAVKKLQKQSDQDPYQELLQWFFEESGFELPDDLTAEAYRKKLEGVNPLGRLVDKYQPEILPEDRYFDMEMILWALASSDKLSKHAMDNGMEFKDLYGSYISGL